MAAIPDRLGRIPLIILDQFDDYLITHRDQFIPDGGGDVITRVRLVAENACWSAISELNEKETIHWTAWRGRLT